MLHHSAPHLTGFLSEVSLTLTGFGLSATLPPYFSLYSEANKLTHGQKKTQLAPSIEQNTLSWNVIEERVRFKEVLVYSIKFG